MCRLCLCRYDLYVEVKLWQKAAETALKLKDRLRLQVSGRGLGLGLRCIESGRLSKATLLTGSSD